MSESCSVSPHGQRTTTGRKNSGESMKILYCAGEQARVTIDILSRTDDDEPIGLLDDNPERHGEFVHGHEILGGEEQFATLNPEVNQMLVTLGRINSERVTIAETIREAGFSLFSVVDPDTTIADTATIGKGVVVNARTYIGPDATLADLALVDSTVNISHDVSLAEGATIAPNATLAGGVKIGENAYVGAGATVLDHTTVGANAVVGAGAVVTEDVQSGTTVVGIPAEPVKP